MGIETWKWEIIDVPEDTCVCSWENKTYQINYKQTIRDWGKKHIRSWDIIRSNRIDLTWESIGIVSESPHRRQIGHGFWLRADRNFYEGKDRNNLICGCGGLRALYFLGLFICALLHLIRILAEDSPSLFVRFFFFDISLYVRVR